ncbi:peptidase S8/S53 domain-containing protein [Paraphysoderma sedebokerense]|nr:peptidase S8/S53 domain-containing protein [Paraphysoderma sedebokerense]
MGISPLIVLLICVTAAIAPLPPSSALNPGLSANPQIPSGHLAKSNPLVSFSSRVHPASISRHHRLPLAASLNSESPNQNRQNEVIRITHPTEFDKHRSTLSDDDEGPIIGPPVAVGNSIPPNDLKMKAERFFVTFRRKISKLEFWNHIRKVKSLCLQEIKRGTHGFNGELPRIIDILEFQPSQKLPEGIHAYVAVLSITVLQEIIKTWGVRIVRDYPVSLDIAEQTSASRMKKEALRLKRRAIDEGEPEVVSPLIQQSIGTDKTKGNWGIDRIDQPSNIRDGYFNYYPAAGQDVRVFVLDSGINPSSSFEDRLQKSKNYIYQENDRDYIEHGTFVASLIGSVEFGVAKNVILHPYKFIQNSQSTWFTEIMRGMYHATKDIDELIKKNQNEKIIVHIPFAHDFKDQVVFPPQTGAEDSKRHEIELLALKMTESGATVIQAIGNRRQNPCRYTLTRLDEVIKVAAVDDKDWLWENSNIGKCASLLAPGVDVLGFGTSAKKAGIRSSTAFGSAHAAGVAALYLSHPRFASIPAKDLPDILKKELVANAWKIPNGDLLAHASFIRQESVKTPGIVNALPQFMQ